MSYLTPPPPPLSPAGRLTSWLAGRPLISRACHYHCQEPIVNTRGFRWCEQVMKAALASSIFFIGIGGDTVYYFSRLRLRSSRLRGAAGPCNIKERQALRIDKAVGFARKAWVQGGCCACQATSEGEAEKNNTSYPHLY